MPGANARALEKGRSLAADVLIMDLEDGVLPDAKVEARGRVLGFLAEGGYGAREIVVRINGIGTPWFQDDLAAVATSGARRRHVAQGGGPGDGGARRGGPGDGGRARRDGDLVHAGDAEGHPRCAP